MKAYNKYLPRQSPLVSDRKPRSLSCTDPVISTPSASNSSNDLVSLLLPIKNSLSNPQLSRKAEVRIWMDGAFDLMHYGHMNAFRQGRALGTTLIVGVNSDETITQCKGKPVFNDQERLDMVKACKWVDKVVEGVPYIMSEEYIAYVIEKYKIDFVVHGDDPCIVDGKDVYESAKKLGKYMSVPRTEGVSTTDIVGRMLMMSNAHLDLEHHTHEAFNTDQDTAGNNSSADKQNIEATEVVNTEVTQDASKCEVSMHDRDKSIAANSHVSHSGAPILDPFEATVSALGLNRKSNFLTTSTIMKLFSADIQV